MASIRVTRQALDWIAQRVLDERIECPLVFVRWAKGQADLSRDSSGAAVWKIEPDGWLVGVFERAELQGAAEWPYSIVEMHGYQFTLVGKKEAPQLEGCALDELNGELVVRENAI